jgi:hypothetical protein
MELKEFFDKLTSYNLFNYLLPGAAFCVIAGKISELNLVQNNLVNAFFVYYLVGMIISRVGSIMIEPVLKFSKFVRFAEYGQYVRKSKEDPLLSTLSEQNNTYRTLLTTFVLLLIVDNFEKVKGKFPWLDNNMPTVLLIGMVILLAFSYRKQTNYIKRRVEN